MGSHITERVPPHGSMDGSGPLQRIIHIVATYLRPGRFTLRCGPVYLLFDQPVGQTTTAQVILR
jgi:hypothetical protein